MHFDLIVSNPPYVGSQDPALRGDGLRSEPRVALTPGPLGLEALEHIAAGARAHLRAGGWLAVEHGADQAGAVAALFSTHGLSTIRTLCDLAGHHRVTAGRLERQP
jgi:release factor glutamine methyltransferase